MCLDCDSLIEDGCTCKCDWVQAQFALYCEKCKHFYLIPDLLPAPIPPPRATYIVTLIPPNVRVDIKIPMSDSDGKI